MKSYWYISDAKLDVLRQSMPRTWAQDLLLKMKFKSPWLEVEVGHRDIKTAVTNSELIERALFKDAKAPKFEELSNSDTPTFVSFEIGGVRAVVDDGYWIAGFFGQTALLLAGAVKHAIGAQATPTTKFSPSIDPFGATASFNSAGVAKTATENLSYAWQEVFRSGGGNSDEATLPRIEGVALFAGRFPAAKAQMRRTGHGAVTHLVLASPIFVRQL